MASNKGLALPIGLIAVIVVLGGITVIVASFIVFRWRHGRSKNAAAVSDEDLPPFQRLAVRRGRVVPASWNLSLGASILGLGDRGSFASLDEDGLTGGRRGKASRARPRFGRSTSATSGTSNKQMSEARGSPSKTFLPATKAYNQDFLQDVDIAFVEKGLPLLPPKSHHSKWLTSESSSTLPSVIDDRDLAKASTAKDSDISIVQKEPRVSESEVILGEDEWPSVKSTKATISKASRPLSSGASIPRSKYAGRTSSNKQSQRLPPSPLSLRSSSVPKLDSVMEVDSPKRPSTAGATLQQADGDRLSQLRQSLPPPARTTPPQQTPAILQSPARPRSSRRRNPLRPHLTPLAVPPPVLSTAPSSPATSHHSSLGQRRKSQATTTPVSPSNRTSISDLSSTYTIAQARPAVVLRSPPSDRTQNPSTRLSSHPNTSLLASPHHPPTIKQERSSYLHPPSPLSKITHGVIPTSPSPTVITTVTSTSRNSMSASQNKERGNIGSQEMRRTPSKKGNVLRKKSLKRAETVSFIN